MTHRMERNWFVSVAAALITMLACLGNAAAYEVYVDASATGADDGSSWADAYTDLQDALALARADSAVDEIWVAAETYKPDGKTGARNRFFRMVQNVAVYGGFAGWETARDQRDWVANETILSGEIGTSAHVDNSFHVVRAVGSSESLARLDGFTIERGYASGSDMHFQEGGGLRVKSATLVVINCTFRNNWAQTSGGAIAILPSSLVYLSDCTFESNETPGYGGAVWNSSDSYDGQAVDCVFRLNSSTGVPGVGGGGGVVVAQGGRMTLINCLFDSNKAYANGGGLSTFSETPLINCTFGDNIAGYGSDPGYGGGIYAGGAYVEISNCVLWDNLDDNGSGEDSQIYRAGGYVGINYSCVQGWSGSFGGTGNIGDDPEFGTADLRLKGISPCIDAADNGALPAGVTEDLDGNDRFVNHAGKADTGSGTSPIVDMGAYEYQYSKWWDPQPDPPEPQGPPPPLDKSPLPPPGP